MADSAALAPLHECIVGYPADAPQWGDELLDAKTDGVPGELRKHLVDALLASRQPPIDGPESVRSYVLSGQLMPLKRKWRAYVLDSRKRLMVRHHRGGVRVRSWVSRRVFNPDELAEKLPLDGGWAYLIVYGGHDHVLWVRDENGGGVADDLANLRAKLPVCDVIGWHPSTGAGVRWWSLAAGGGMDGIDTFELEGVAISLAGGNGWGPRPAPAPVERVEKTKPFSALVPGWGEHDPDWGDELLDADTSRLSPVAQQLQRHLLLATRSGTEITITSPDECRQRLTERLFKPKPGRWSAYVLDENRRRDMVPSEWGMSARQTAVDSTPTIELLAKKLPLPNKGRWLVIWWGDPENLCNSDAAEVQKLLGDDRVADVCSWGYGTFASARAQSMVDANHRHHELTVAACRQRRASHHPNNQKEGTSNAH